MPLVSASQLTALRNIAYNGLDTPVLIERPTQTENDFGSSETWTTVTTTLGWVREMSTTRPGEALNWIVTTGTFRLHLAVDTDIEPGDRVTIGGKQFTVSEVNDENTIRIFTTAVLRRVE